MFDMKPRVIAVKRNIAGSNKSVKQRENSLATGIARKRSRSGSGNHPDTLSKKQKSGKSVEPRKKNMEGNNQDAI